MEHASRMSSAARHHLRPTPMRGRAFASRSDILPERPTHSNPACRALSAHPAHDRRKASFCQFNPLTPKYCSRALLKPRPTFQQPRPALVRKRYIGMFLSRQGNALRDDVILTVEATLNHDIDWITDQVQGQV